MSAWFKIEPVTADQVNKVRQELGCSLEQAKHSARRENLEGAIHRARDIEDLKVCMLSLLSLTPKWG